MEAPLFCATVLYPNEPDASFDFEVYTKELMPEYISLMGDNCVRHEIRKGLATPQGAQPSFVCIASVWVTSAEKFGKAMADPRMAALMQKIASFTTIKPLRQFDAVVSS